MAATTHSVTVATSCSILSPRISLQRIRIPNTFNYNNNTCHFPIASPVTVSVSHQFSPFLFPGKSPRHSTTAVFSASSTDDNHIASQDLAVLLEVDGVLVDAYRVGNRLAFNKAFEKFGLDCASWNEPVYSDLLRRSAGDEEKMLYLYFNRIGWPSSLPTNEKGVFTKRVLQAKEKALEEFVTSTSLPLRPGVEQFHDMEVSFYDASPRLHCFLILNYAPIVCINSLKMFHILLRYLFIDDAYNEGIPVVILTAYIKNGDNIARTIIEKLGNDRSKKVIIVGIKEAEQSLHGQLVSGKVIASGLDEELSKEATRAAAAERQRLAKEVASALKLSVAIDTSLSERVIILWFACLGTANVLGLGSHFLCSRWSAVLKLSANFILKRFDLLDPGAPPLEERQLSLLSWFTGTWFCFLPCRHFSGSIKTAKPSECQIVANEKEAEKMMDSESHSKEVLSSLHKDRDKIVTALHAGAECAGLPICNCVLIAGSQSGVAGAERAGMPCVVLRSSLTSRAEFPLAIATMDGFGGADLTISKLRNLCQKKQPED
ncbi:hypothetical protein TSUD_408480 [Trifolium subterraneum]|uniref:Haloacid dehalogenase-like hydrolase domain-containing protein n=1 Tax=Trifolium subterraneum TaxID=3900 RepID=A0A2Z6PI36_TRISU|nr:hypothetical protein TSUD_408480 [Trifolium subterraneum]